MSLFSLCLNNMNNNPVADNTRNKRPISSLIRVKEYKYDVYGTNDPTCSEVNPLKNTQFSCLRNSLKLNTEKGVAIINVIGIKIIPRNNLLSKNFLGFLRKCASKNVNSIAPPVYFEAIVKPIKIPDRI